MPEIVAMTTVHTDIPEKMHLFGKDIVPYIDAPEYIPELGAYQFYGMDVCGDDDTDFLILYDYDDETDEEHLILMDLYVDHEGMITIMGSNDPGLRGVQISIDWPFKDLENGIIEVANRLETISEKE